MPLKNHNLIIAGLAAVLVCVVFYSYWSLVYTPVGQTIAAERKSVQELNQKLNTAKSRAGQLSKVQAEMATLQIDVAELEKLLPKTRELPSLLRVFTHRAETNGITLTSFTPSRPVSKGLYDEIPYDIKVTSSLHGIGHFLTAMGKGDRLFAARNLALTATGGKTDPSKTVNATLLLWPLNTMNNARITILQIVFVAILWLPGSYVFSVSALGTPLDKQTAPMAGTSANPGVVTEPAPSYKNYIYFGDRYRDPFVPLNGDIRSDQSAMDRPPQIAALVLKGIVQDARGRMALLTSGVSSYILKGGRLYDGRNRMVKKIAGVIKTDSVVIIGADRTVRELKTKAPL